MALLNPGGAIAQFQRNDCSISPVEVISASGVHNGNTDAFEMGLGLSLILSIGEDDKASTVDEDDSNFDDIDDDDFAESNEDECESGIEKLESLREELSELEEQLVDLECSEPDDILSARYERWESRKEQLEEQISDINDEIFDLELKNEV